MTPVYDWTHFDAIRDALRDEYRDKPVTMRQAGCEAITHTPAHFVDAWAAGYRP